VVTLAHTKAPPHASSRNSSLSARDAARALWVDRWVSYPRAERILSRLDDLLYLPPRVRMQNVLIHGTSRAGKSMIIEKFMRNHPESSRQDAARPIITMQMPPWPTLRCFFSELLRSFDCTVIIGSRISELEHDALRQLKKAKPQLLATDEIHHLLACTPREQRAALNVVKFLSNELRVSIIVLGTGEALHVMRADSQIASRFDPAPSPLGPPTSNCGALPLGFFSKSRSNPATL
jgi:hypothetical protein